jgi:hypothetical protein
MLNDMNKQTKVSDLQEGPIRHPVLPDGMVERIKAFKDALGDVDTVSIEKTIDGFKRDANPEDQLLIWERVASTFETYLAHNPTNDPAIRKEVFAVIMGASMGMHDWSAVKHLSQAQINHIVLNYAGV